MDLLLSLAFRTVLTLTLGVNVYQQLGCKHARPHFWATRYLLVRKCNYLNHAKKKPNKHHLILNTVIVCVWNTKARRDSLTRENSSKFLHEGFSGCDVLHFCIKFTLVCSGLGSVTNLNRTVTKPNGVNDRTQFFCTSIFGSNNHISTEKKQLH